MAERYDLIVVGAGPAGSSTAYYAARYGLKTLLLDRQEFPRDKPCGDGLMPHAASEITHMGLGDWLEEPQHGKFSGFTMYTRTAHLSQKVPPTLHGPSNAHRNLYGRLAGVQPAQTPEDAGNRSTRYGA